MPTTSELAALIVGDFDNSYTKRDIIVKRQCGKLQRIDELHMAYLSLQYPLFFPYGDNGYDSSNQHALESLSATKKKKKLTPREYLAFRLMRRKSETSVILHGNKLLQQFIVDGYSMVESDRLDYIRKHQKELRVDLYSGITNLYDVEYLNAIKCSGIPHHKLVLKVGVPVMLIRNIDQAAGMCNGTRLQISQLGKNVIKAKALNGTSIGEEILIHRMDMNPSETKLPFNMTRRQFPIIISFAMTINKSQECSNTTLNVVYREVFQNLVLQS
ncbi:hypothetical protein K1719_027920 [Acacia pycnantha]|nr:hypothetical protein K1719_027920 [Acacia pycnantha]